MKRGWDVGSVTVLIFPPSRSVQTPYLTTDRIDAVGRKRFAAWGGGGEAEAVHRLEDCAAAYKNSK